MGCLSFGWMFNPVGELGLRVWGVELNFLGLGVYCLGVTAQRGSWLGGLGCGAYVRGV